MKVGIITMHNVNNYGAVLQTYALANQIEILGHESVIINYIPEVRRGIKVIFPPSDSMIVKRILSWIKWLPAHISRIKPFKKFIKCNYKNMTDVCYANDIHKYYDTFDAYVTGSDQVWNSDSTRGIDENYFLHFVNKNKKKISYAASLSSIKYEKKEDKAICGFLRDFTNISIREAVMIPELTSISQKRIVQAIDPTVLVGLDFWKSFSREERDTISSNYCLVYILGEDGSAIQFAKQKAKEINGKTVKISFMHKKDVDVVITNPSPEKFVSLFLNADYVVTNSLHGMLFSMICNKNFSIPSKLTNQTRFKDLIITYGLSEFMGTLDKTIIDISPDYLILNDRIESLRIASMNYLKGSLTEGDNA